ncbi:hypothetical protein BKA93DRAFT_828018 [Sparassis latifolia]
MLLNSSNGTAVHRAADSRPRPEDPGVPFAVGRLRLFPPYSMFSVGSKYQGAAVIPASLGMRSRRHESARSHSRHSPQVPAGAVVGSIIGSILTQLTERVRDVYFMTGVPALVFVGGFTAFDKGMPSTVEDKRVDRLVRVRGDGADRIRRGLCVPVRGATLTHLGGAFGLAITTVVYDATLKRVSLPEGIVINVDSTNVFPPAGKLHACKDAFFAAILAIMFLRTVGTLGGRRKSNELTEAEEKAPLGIKPSETPSFHAVDLPRILFSLRF